MVADEAELAPQGQRQKALKAVDDSAQTPQSAASEDSFRAQTNFTDPKQEVRVPKPLHLSDLSPGRQALVRLCQAINHGSIEHLEVRHSEPVFDPWPVAVRDVKLDKDEEARPEKGLQDFALSDEVVRLMERLDEMDCGTIRCIEVHAGLPRRMLIESPGSAYAGGGLTQ